MECWFKGPTKFHSYFCNLNFVSLHSWWFETKKSTCYFRQWQGSANNGSQEESFMARRGRGADRKKEGKTGKRAHSVGQRQRGRRPSPWKVPTGWL